MDDVIEDDGKVLEIKTAVGFLPSVFHAPLAAKNVCTAIIHGEREEMVDHARKHLVIGTESYRGIRYKLQPCPDTQMA